MELCFRKNGSKVTWEMVPISWKPEEPDDKCFVALHHLFGDRQPPVPGYSHRLLRVGAGDEDESRQIHNRLISQFPHFAIRQYYDLGLEVRQLGLASFMDPNCRLDRIKVDGESVDDLMSEVDRLRDVETRRKRKLENLKSRRMQLQKEAVQAIKKYNKDQAKQKARDNAIMELEANVAETRRVKDRLKSTQDKLREAREKQCKREIELSEPIAYGIMPMDHPEFIAQYAPVPVVALRYSDPDHSAFYVLADARDMAEEEEQEEQKEEEEEEGQGEETEQAD